MPASKNASSLLRFERSARQEGFRFVLGVDEAGRGPLAGPVVAAAVMLKTHAFTCPIRDSKTLSPRQRDAAFDEITQKALIGTGMISAALIDAHNILLAAEYAMTKAINSLVRQLLSDLPEGENLDHKVILLVDGNRFRTDLPFAMRTIVKGDSLSLSIACASIVAKVMRDRVLCAYDQIFPQYGFRKHKGYPTSEHCQAIQDHGPSPIHRRSFKRVL